MIFDGSASKWIWRYQKTVKEVTWQGLKTALRAQFQDGRSDLVIRLAMSQRKQKLNDKISR